jgi:ribosomal protein L6P/L9E
MLRGMNKGIDLQGAQCKLSGDLLEIAGKLGTLSLPKAAFIQCNLQDTVLVVSTQAELDKQVRAMVGTFIALTKKAITGTMIGHKRSIFLSGTGSSIKIKTIAEQKTELTKKRDEVEKKLSIAETLTETRVVQAELTKLERQLAEAVNDLLILRVGKSHLVEKRIPAGLQCKIDSADTKQTKMSVFGIDDQTVGQFAAELRIKRAYKGGIHAWVEGDPSIIKKRKGSK